MIELTRLNVPVPPQLEQAIGYEEEVAQHWLVLDRGRRRSNTEIPYRNKRSTSCDQGF